MSRPPLDAVRILAVSQFGAGPFGTQMLADLGADVIKIEDPGVGGDSARYVPPFAGDADSPYFQSFNRGKRSLALNLRHPDGRAVFHDLVRVSDAVFNNARGDLPDKLGLTYEALRAANPRIVCCSLTGYGRTGPRAAEPAFRGPGSAAPLTGASWHRRCSFPPDDMTRGGFFAVDSLRGVHILVVDDEADCRDLLVRCHPLQRRHLARHHAAHHALTTPHFGLAAAGGL